MSIITMSINPVKTLCIGTKTASVIGSYNLMINARTMLSARYRAISNSATCLNWH